MSIHSHLGSVSFGAVAGGGEPEEDSSPATALEITPDILAMRRGQSVRAQVTARFADGSARDVSHEAETHWSSGDTTILSVTETGLVIAGNLGVTTLRVEFRGVRTQVIGAVLAHAHL